jgi:hypothetical protein
MHGNVKQILLTDDGTRQLLIDELKELRGVSRGLDEASFVDRRVGHCEWGESIAWKGGRGARRGCGGCGRTDMELGIII